METVTFFEYCDMFDDQDEYMAIPLHISKYGFLFVLFVRLSFEKEYEQRGIFLFSRAKIQGWEKIQAEEYLKEKMEYHLNSSI